MSIETGVERLAALVLILTCLSHIAAPAAWDRLFKSIGAKSETAGLAIAAIHLPLGLMIVAFHPVWDWPGIVVTLIGWGFLIKGTAHLVFPQLAKRSIAMAGEGGRRYRFAGVAMLPLVALLGWIALR